MTSKRVTVIVEIVAPSSGIDEGLAATVDVLALTGPAVKFTVVVAIITREASVTSVAVNTSEAAVVDFTVKVTTPAVLEGPEAADIVGVPEPDVLARVVVFPETGLLPASSKVTVTVEVVEPSARTDAGDAFTVDVPALTDPTLIVTLPLVPVLLPVAEVAVNVPDPVVPVYFIPKVVIFATPELKSPAPVSLFPPVNPDIVPESVVLIVTLFAEASKVVIVLLPISCAVRLFVPVKATPSTCGDASVKAKWSNPPTLIVTLPLVPVLLPVAEVAVNVPPLALPVYFNPSVVRLATPEVKSAAFVSLLVPDNPDIVPVNGVTAAIVTVLVEALKLLKVLLPISCAVSVFVPVKATPSVCGEARTKAK